MGISASLIKKISHKKPKNLINVQFPVLNSHPMGIENRELSRTVVQVATGVEGNGLVGEGSISLRF
jgi:hypothetical protein